MLSLSSSLLKSCTRVVLVNSAVPCAIVVQLPPQFLHTSKLVLVNSADSSYRFLFYAHWLIRPNNGLKTWSATYRSQQLLHKNLFRRTINATVLCFAAADVNHHFRDIGPGDRVLRYPMRWRHMDPNCDVIYIKSVDMLSRATNGHLRRWIEKYTKFRIPKSEAIVKLHILELGTGSSWPVPAGAKVSLASCNHWIWRKP